MPRLIRGVVRDLHGRPVSSARAYFTSTPIPVPDVAVLTNERGEFELTAPTSGDYGVEVAAEGYASEGAIVRVQEGNAEIELRLSPS